MPSRTPTLSANRPFDLQSHRGARGLWPENTMAGIDGALALGVSSIELDAVLTADGVPVVFHDLRLSPNLARGPDGAWLAPPGPVLAGLRASDLAGYDVGRPRPGSRSAARFPLQQPIDGARIPRLDDICARLRGTGVTLDIDIKNAGDPSAMAQAVLHAVATAGNPAVAYRSFDWRVLHHIRHLQPGAAVAWLTPAVPRPAPHAIAAQAAPRGAAEAWAPDHRSLRRQDIIAAHAAGLRVLPWTVNSAGRMAQLIAWGADGFCTDRPDIARIVMADAGLRLPARVIREDSAAF